MKIHHPGKSILVGLLGGIIVLQPMLAHAAVHPAAFVKTESAALQTLDLAINTDWDFDASPTITTRTGVPLNRAYITATLGHMAKSVYTMTEGRHRVGTVFVYKNNRYGNAVNAKLVNASAGRSNAAVAAWGKRAGTTNNYVGYLQNGQYATETPASLGKVMAHEFGHYLYGLLDEYADASRPLDVTQPALPVATDTPLGTLMNDQNAFVGLSTPGEIGSSTQTAQRRVYGGSAWEMLSRPAAADPSTARDFGRTAFSAFSGFVPAGPAQLAKPVQGWDAAFRVEFVDNPLDSHIYVVSRRIDETQLAAVKNALVQSIRQIAISPRSAVTFVAVGGDEAASQVLLPRFALSSDDARGAALSMAESIGFGSTGGDMDATLSSVLSDVAAQHAAGSAKPGDSVAIHVFANSENSISVATRDRAKALRVAVNANLIDSYRMPEDGLSSAAAGSSERSAKSARATASAGNVTLAQLAYATGGVFTDSQRATALVAGAIKSQAVTQGKPFVAITSAYQRLIRAIFPFEMQTPVLASTDGKLTFAVRWTSDVDSGKIRYALTAPDGTLFEPANPQEGQPFGVNQDVNYVMDADGASAYFEVSASYPGRNGVWTSTVVANESIFTPIEQFATAESTLHASADVLRDGTPDPVIMVSVATDRAVRGAAVTASIYAADGTLALVQTLNDDGRDGDRQSGDGIYSSALGGKLVGGQYSVAVTTTQGPNGAVLSTAGSTVRGQNAAPEPLGGAFSRQSETLLTIAQPVVTEYYVPTLRKYFMTSRENEKADLARFPAIYTPTGMSFVAEPGLAVPAQTQPICRYYFAPPLANTHFYGTPGDCVAVANAYAGNRAVTNEGIAFAVKTPDLSGLCPTSAPVKVYRSFNNRSAQNDGNHRYTVSIARYNQMTAQGFTPDGAVFCVAAATDAAQ